MTPLLSTAALLFANAVLPVRVTDRVLAFSEDGRAALVERATNGGPRSLQRALFIVEADASIGEPIEFSRYVLIDDVARELVDARDCRTRAAALEPSIDARFFGIASVDIGGCARPSREIVDVKRNLRVTPLSAGEIAQLTEEHGPGSFVAAPDGPLVVQLASDPYGNTRVVGAFSRRDSDRIHGRW